MKGREGVASPAGPPGNPRSRASQEGKGWRRDEMGDVRGADTKAEAESPKIDVQRRSWD